MTSVLRTGIPHIILELWDLTGAPSAPPITQQHTIWEENSVGKPLSYISIQTMANHLEGFPWGTENYDFFSTMVILDFVQFCME